PVAKGALKGMGAVSAGLIAAVGLKLVGALKTNVMTVGVCVALAAMTFVAIAILRIPLAWVLLVLGSAAMAWAYRQLGLLADQADGGTQ
nr:chromate transporter [Polaromonas sp.]